MTTNNNITDVLIIGAGLSGIGAAYHIQDKCPNKSYQILEAREAMGGTWDLFRYPGIRSDSDMYTLGFSFNPWTSTKALADGPAILQYIKDTAAKFGIDKKIQYNHKVVDASWSDTDKLWTLTIAATDSKPAHTLQCRFVFMCSGYYSYASGYKPAFKGSESFEGRIVHPQEWTQDIDYTNKRVTVIGSGATAVTMVPEMAKKAAKVTMLQRSPTYIISLPGEDVIAKFLGKIMPKKWSYAAIRWKNILLSQFLYKLARRRPTGMRNWIIKNAQKQLPENYDMKHFKPKYNVWDQRLCIVPDADLFEAIKQGTAEVVTDTIDHFTPKGIKLNSGQEVEADIIVTATGLNLQLLGGMTVHINGKLLATSDLHVYRGVMGSGVPNFAMAVGYTNASWTLKCDLNCHFVTRILNYMDKHGYTTCTPQFDSEAYDTEPLLDFDAGYIKRAMDVLPKQGSEAPWKVYQSYLHDLISLKHGSISDKHLVYG